MGKRVLVIGGGSVAVDVALTARRLGAAEVSMACLESLETMPAISEDVEQALEEQINILPSWGPHRVLEQDGKLTGMELVRCTAVFDKSGRFAPTFDTSRHNRGRRGPNSGRDRSGRRSLVCGARAQHGARTARWRTR